MIPGESTVSTEHEFFPGKAGDKAYPPGPFGSGPRVPMFVLSPWSTGGWVCSEKFDHTSVIRFMEKRFGVREPQITPWRREVFGDLTSAFDFSKSPAKAPSMMNVDAWKPKDSSRHPDYKPVPPAEGQMPKQESGTRPARPLGYDLQVTERQASGALKLELANSGTLGACFQVRRLEPAGDPHSYTVGARRSLTATLPTAGHYRVEMHGPNGFFRGFEGDDAVGARVRVEQRGRSGRAHLVIERDGDVDVKIESAYRGAVGETKGKRGRGRLVIDLDTSRFGGWYDVTVTIPGTSFKRTLAGHLETGKPSTSEPQLGA